MPGARREKDLQQANPPVSCARAKDPGAQALVETWEPSAFVMVPLPESMRTVSVEGLLTTGKPPGVHSQTPAPFVFPGSKVFIFVICNRWRACVRTILIARREEGARCRKPAFQRRHQPVFPFLQASLR